MRRTMMAALLLMGAAPAAAEVKEAGEGGFTISLEKVVAASPDKVWAALVVPGSWWSSAHSWSGDAKNFALDARAGGCFCERWSAGEAEHGRVIQAVKGKLLRISGALGPLQGEALVGTLTFALKPEGTGTRISLDYVVGGHARFPLKTITTGVDAVIGEQLGRLATLVGG